MIQQIKIFFSSLTFEGLSNQSTSACDLQLALSDSKYGITWGKFKKPDDYSVDLLCYYVPPEIIF